MVPAAPHDHRLRVQAVVDHRPKPLPRSTRQGLRHTPALEGREASPVAQWKRLPPVLRRIDPGSIPGRARDRGSGQYEPRETYVRRPRHECGATRPLGQSEGAPSLGPPQPAPTVPGAGCFDHQEGQEPVVIALHPGMPVLLPPRKGWGGPSYAMVAKALTPHRVRVVITADSGGRSRGARYDISRRRVQTRRWGQHRRPKPPRKWWQSWS